MYQQIFAKKNWCKQVEELNLVNLFIYEQHFRKFLSLLNENHKDKIFQGVFLI